MDASIYEREHPTREEQAFGFAFGRITEVFAKERYCTVVTFLGKGSLNDNYIPRCQWVNLDSNPEGDESTSIPRKNSIGLVFYVDGEPFIFGFFKPLSRNAATVTGDEPAKLIEGDKVISTVAGNKITVKSNGAIEIVSSDTLRRTMIPKGSAIFDLCRRYQLRTDGGTIDWGSDPITQLTVHKAEYRRDLLRTFIMTEDRGGVDLTTVWKRQVGPAVPGVLGVQLPSFTETISNLGVYELQISPPSPVGTPIGIRTKISPDGSYNFKSGPIPNFELDISPTGAAKVAVNSLITINLSATGALEVKNPTSKLSLTESGDIEVSNPLVKVNALATGDFEISAPGGTVKISNAGEMSFTALQKVKIDAKAGIDVQSLGPVNLEAKAPVKLKALGTIELDGGTGATENVLTYPSTINAFTGSPLVPFSTTVKVSK
jgi:phage gp45-like